MPFHYCTGEPFKPVEYVVGFKGMGSSKGFPTSAIAGPLHVIVCFVFCCTVTSPLLRLRPAYTQVKF